MAIGNYDYDNSILQQAVIQYMGSRDDETFNEIYRLVTPKLVKMVRTNIIRYNRVDPLDAQAAADDALLDALKRYRLDDGVMFSAFLNLVVGRRLAKYVQSLYYAGKNRDIERPATTDITLVAESSVLSEPDFTPESSIREAMSYIKSSDDQLFRITYMLMNGWNDETVGRIIGGRDTADSAKSWTRRQRAKIATVLKRFQLES